MNADDERDAETRAEARLVRHVDELREDPPTPDPALLPSVLRSVRWQHAVRPYFTAVGRIVSAVGTGVRVLVGGQRPR